MNKTAIALAVAASITGVGNVSAASMEDRMMAMEKRLEYLEQRLAEQDKVIAEKEKQITELTGGSDGGGTWFRKVEIGGVVEIEANSADGPGDHDTDLITPTVELGIAAQINDWIAGEIVLLYEEGTDNDGDLNVDTALLTIANPDSNWFINAGQYVVPFGMYSTNMVSDPLTLGLGETGDTAAEFGMIWGSLTGSVYALQGDWDDTTTTGGVALTYETDSFVGHIGYLSNLSESDGVVDAGINDDAGGLIASAEFTFGRFVLIGEYLTATDDFGNAGNDDPSAWNIELGYNFEAMSKPATFAIGYQGTDDMADAAWTGTANEMIEESIVAAYSMEIMDATSIAIEYRNDEDYAGGDYDTLTGLLSVEF
jgi:hypothetical protein